MSDAEIEAATGISSGFEEAAALPRRMLPRVQVAEYFSLEGLQRLTGVQPKDLDRLILKELIDNALDACDETASLRIPTLSINVQKMNGFIKLQVDDNASGIEAKDIEKITNFKYLYSSRFHYKYPTRGALGNAWKYILGASYALASVMNTNHVPITILSKDTKCDIHIQCKNGEVMPEIMPTKIRERVGTTVIVSLPVYNKLWGVPKRYLRDVKTFAYVNPRAKIIFQGITFDNLETSYQPSRKLRESPHWFSRGEFLERFQAQTKDHLERDEHLRLTTFIRQFRGTSRDSQVASVLRRCNLDNCLLEDVLDNSNLVVKIHEAMKTEGKPPSPNILREIGKKNFGQRISQIDGLLVPSDRYYKYKSRRDVSRVYAGETEVLVPFIVEAGIGVNSTGVQSIHIGINGSAKLEDPFAGRVFFDEPQVWAGIRGILEKNGISQDQGVTALVHITCPNVQYTDPGKTHINIDLFYNAIKEVVDKASKFYRRAKSRIELLRKSDGNSDRIPERQKEAVFDVLMEAFRKITSDGRFPYYKQRQLWYVVRGLLSKRGWIEFCPSYDYFPVLLIQYEEERNIKLEGLLLEANAELHEPRSEKVIMLSTEGEANYEIPEWKYNKILYVEKRGFKDVILANGFHDRFDMAVIGAQGEPGKASRVLLKRIEEVALKKSQRIDIFCIHDADIWGYDIHLSLSGPSRRMPSHSVHIIELGLSMMEAAKLGLEPERMTFKKPRRIPRKVLEHLPIEELSNLTGKQDMHEIRQPLKESFRVELNAFTPEAFLDWLTHKLEEHGVKEKVRPPDEVITQETRRQTGESLEKHIKDLMFEAAGGKTIVDQAKAKVVNKENLNNLDLTQDVDEVLKTYPLNGWREILEEKVASCVDSIFGKEETRNEVLGIVQDRLKSGNKTEKKDQI